MEPKVEDALPNARLGNRVLALSAHWHYGLGMPAGQIADLLNDHLNPEVPPTNNPADALVAVDKTG